MSWMVGQQTNFPMLVWAVALLLFGQISKGYVVEVSAAADDLIVQITVGSVTQTFSSGSAGPVSLPFKAGESNPYVAIRARNTIGFACMGAVLTVKDDLGTVLFTLVSNTGDWYSHPLSAGELVPVGWDTYNFDPVAAGCVRSVAIQTTPFVVASTNVAGIWPNDNRVASDALFYYRLPICALAPDLAAVNAVSCVDYAGGAILTCANGFALSPGKTSGRIFSFAEIACVPRCDTGTLVCDVTEQCVFGTCVTSVLECQATDPIAAAQVEAGCGYYFPGSSVASNATLHTKFVMPSYTTDTLTQTYICARSLVDLPTCSGETGISDFVSLNIPNIVDVNLPCHVDARGKPVWGFDAWSIPTVSDLDSHLEVAFTGSGVTPLAKYFGPAISHVYVTRVAYTDDAAGRNLMSAHLAEFGASRNPENIYIYNDIPSVCDTSFPGLTLVYNFWDTCANRWVESPLDSKWNTLTDKSACYCHSPASAPYLTALTASSGTIGMGFPASNNAQYYWWFGTCNACVNGANDPLEAQNAYLPFSNVDSDSDGISDNCDLCAGYDDNVDVNKNRIPDSCDLCLLGVDRCEPLDTCTDGPNSLEFGCECASGYMIKGIFVNSVNLANAIYAGRSTVITWLNSDARVVSSDFAGLTQTSFIDSITNSSAFTTTVNLAFDLTTTAVAATLELFLDAVTSSTTGCTTCGTYTLSLSYVTTQASANADIVANVTVHVLPYQTFQLYNGPAGANRGCQDIDECALYGCDANSDCYQSIIATGVNPEYQTQINQRMCVCHDGWSTANGSASEVLDTDAKFPGCKKIDYCLSTPCGANSACTSLTTSYSCECLPGYFDFSGDGKACANPCKSNNGACQDKCNDPADGNNYYCSCQDANAFLVGDRRRCACKPGYHGDGLTCYDDEVCLVHSAFGDSFIGIPTGFRNVNSNVCGSYSDNSCCDLRADVYDRARYLNRIKGGSYVRLNLMVTNLHLSCADNLAVLFCATCDPEQKFFFYVAADLVFSICTDYCYTLYESCSHARYADDESKPPQYLTNLHSDPVEWCEEFLPRLFPFSNSTRNVTLIIDAQDMDRATCYSSGSVLQPVVTTVLVILSLYFRTK